MMRETGGNGVGQTHADVDHHIGVFDKLFHRRIAGAAAVGPDKPGSVLIQHAFAKQQRSVRNVDRLQPLVQRRFGTEAIDQEVRQQRYPPRRQQLFARCGVNACNALRDGLA